MKKLLPLLLIGACGGKVGEALRPNDPSAAQAMNENQCTAANTIQPLVIDLDSAERTDLELAMRSGVMVVSYDCKSLKLLKGCQLEGSYAFAAVVPKEDLVQIKNADELLANMPISGAKLEAEIKAGSSIDLVLVTIGQRGATLMTAAKSDLKGPECAKATHFVRAAYVGGFSMTKKTAGSAKAAAEGFGAKANAASGSDKLAAAHDGDLDTCRQSTADVTKPPEKCQSPLRIEIVPITSDKTIVAEGGDKPRAKPAPGTSASATPSASAAPSGSAAPIASASSDPASGSHPPPTDKCIPPMVWTGSMCAKQDTAQHQCKSNDEADCTAQCTAGHGGSCTSLGYMHFQDSKVALDAFEKGCKLRDAHSCFAHAERLLMDRTKSKDDAERARFVVAAQKDTDTGCGYGDGWVCYNTATWYKAGSVYPKDMAKSASLLKRSCDLGYSYGCLSLANAAIAGDQGVPKDLPFATALLTRACESGNWEHCERLGNAYNKGELGPKDPVKALDALGKSCGNGGARACATAGTMLAKGDGVPADAARAKDFYMRGCNEKIRGWDACLALGEIYEKANDKAHAAEVYERGCMLGACARAAAIWEKGDGVTADPAKANALYGRACGFGDMPSCDRAGATLEKTDKDKAAAYYLDMCTRMWDQPLCDSAKRLGQTIPTNVKPHARLKPPPPPPPAPKP
jgi:TPR repeat protein